MTMTKSGQESSSSGSKGLDKVEEAAEKVLGDSQVGKGERVGYVEDDSEARTAATAAAHGDEAILQEDGTHLIISKTEGDPPVDTWRH
ncbi:hypothetical protein [Brevibacterium gallinarum]|uniref:DUF2188 domain-containing protein n=1 Tax=Brevibacterium gallinarum TaxID=2762220 RepID=A0ABR8WT39_9MICO|nr:hypothetical protein [Brevibacterium gallinarum]MBD8020240.1 hypothetical protein [Brevibacterium gallinarum]